MSEEQVPDEVAPAPDEVAAEPVRTGMADVDTVVDSVADLTDRPVDEHVAVFESAHEELRRTLDAPPDEAE